MRHLPKCITWEGSHRCLYHLVRQINKNSISKAQWYTNFHPCIPFKSISAVASTGTESISNALLILDELWNTGWEQVPWFSVSEYSIVKLVGCRFLRCIDINIWHLVHFSTRSRWCPKASKFPELCRNIAVILCWGFQNIRYELLRGWQ